MNQEQFNAAIAPVREVILSPPAKLLHEGLSWEVVRAINELRRLEADHPELMRGWQQAEYNRQLEEKRAAHKARTDLVTSARVEARDYQSHMMVTIEGKEVQAFSFYADELSIDPASMVGKTLKECRERHYEADLAYIQS